MVPEPIPTQDPCIAKHPADKLMPLEKVEVAVVEETLRTPVLMVENEEVAVVPVTILMVPSVE